MLFPSPYLCFLLYINESVLPWVCHDQLAIWRWECPITMKNCQERPMQPHRWPHLPTISRHVDIGLFCAQHLYLHAAAMESVGWNKLGVQIYWRPLKLARANFITPSSSFCRSEVVNVTAGCLENHKCNTQSRVYYRILQSLGITLFANGVVVCEWPREEDKSLWGLCCHSCVWLI